MMSFDYDRISSGQGRGCVTAGNGKGQRKVTRAEDDNRPKRSQHRPHIRLAQRRASRIRWIDPCVNPRTFFNQFCEETKLTTGAPGLGADAGGRKCCLVNSARYQRVTELLDVVGDSSQEGGFRLA